MRSLARRSLLGVGAFALAFVATWLFLRSGGAPEAEPVHEGGCAVSATRSPERLSEDEGTRDEVPGRIWYRGLLSDPRDESAKPVARTTDEVRAAVRAVSVALVGDYHTVSEPKHLCAEVLAFCREPSRGSVALALESIPCDWDDVLRDLLASRPGADAQSFSALLDLCWPWPNADLGNLLVAAQADGVAVIPAGRALRLPAAGTADARREPPLDPTVRRRPDDLAFMQGPNCVCVERTRAWLAEEGDSKRRVVVLYGVYHVKGGDGSLAKRFGDAGVRTVILLPPWKTITSDLETAIGGPPSAPWYELEAGVFYATRVDAPR